MTPVSGAPEDLSAHLRACEEALLDPAIRRHRALVEAFLAEDFREFGSSGRVWSREEILELLETEDYTPPALEDFCCQSIAEDVALVTYRTVRKNPATGLGAAVLRCSLWKKSSGGWKVHFHQGTMAL